jgi:hypothetical protein
LNIDVLDNWNKTKTLIYEDGHVTKELLGKFPGWMDQQTIDQSVRVHGPSIRIQFWTAISETLKSKVEGDWAGIPHGSTGVDQDLAKLKELNILKHELIYDEELLSVDQEGSLLRENVISSFKRELNIFIKCKQYVPNEKIDLLLS